MMKIISQINDPAFHNRLKAIHPRCETAESELELPAVAGLLKRGDLLLTGQLPEQGFYQLKASVIVVSRDRDIELMAARLGAKGFISPDLPDALLLQAVETVAAGEIWMSREAIAQVFSEFAKLMSRDPQSNLHSLLHR